MRLLFPLALAALLVTPLALGSGDAFTYDGAFATSAVAYSDFTWFEVDLQEGDHVAFDFAWQATAVTAVGLHVSAESTGPSKPCRPLQNPGCLLEQVRNGPGYNYPCGVDRTLGVGDAGVIHSTFAAPITGTYTFAVGATLNVDPVTYQVRLAVNDAAPAEVRVTDPPWGIGPGPALTVVCELA